MNNANLSMLNQAELLQLALNASGVDDSASAIAYLKEAVQRADASAVTHYILGAEYAQMKMYERAIDEIEAALALDPALSSARLQLGLLWMARNTARALTVLEPLKELGAQDCLYHFGAGLLHLIRDEIAETIMCLQTGIGLNQKNPALSGDMQKIIDEIARLPAAEASARQEAEAVNNGGHYLFLSAYKGNQNH